MTDTQCTQSSVVNMGALSQSQTIHNSLAYHHKHIIKSPEIVTFSTIYA